MVGSDRPVLRYIETHLVEHCNLSCNRCGHFSPLAPPAFSSAEEFDRDLGQLARVFSNIGVIRLMGGEPLLHPTPGAFVEVARTRFPSADIHIVTNGTLLKSMPPDFWTTCREHRVVIDLSLYPVMEKARTQIQAMCAQHGVTLAIGRADFFLAGINPRGDSDPARAMAYCRSQYYCPLLHGGRLYVCGFPATVHYFNERFNRDITAAAGIDIYDTSISGTDILNLLEQPVETCRFCSCAYESHPWQSVRIHRAEDYEVSADT